MREADLIEEVIGQLQLEQEIVERALEAKQKAHQNTVFSLSELPFCPTWKKPLKPLLKKILKRKQKKLETEIAILKGRLELCILAEAECREGVYGSAIPILDQIADRFLVPVPFSLSNLDRQTSGFVPPPMFFHLVNLEKELISLQKQSP